MSAPSMTKFVMKRPWLKRWMQPLSECVDDLIPEESDVVMLALKRLPPKEAYDRVFRLRRAFQCSLSHQLLPKDQQTKPEEDYLYLSPIIKEIEQENRERGDLEAMVVNNKKKSKS
ncbi:MAG: hypothetical protein Q9228_000727 [Teloschistes exilis]